MLDLGQMVIFRRVFGAAFFFFEGRRFFFYDLFAATHPKGRSKGLRYGGFFVGGRGAYLGLPFHVSFLVFASSG